MYAVKYSNSSSVMHALQIADFNLTISLPIWSNLEVCSCRSCKKIQKKKNQNTVVSLVLQVNERYLLAVVLLVLVRKLMFEFVCIKNFVLFAL